MLSRRKGCPFATETKPETRPAARYYLQPDAAFVDLRLRLAPKKMCTHPYNNSRIFWTKRVCYGLHEIQQ